MSEESILRGMAAAEEDLYVEFDEDGVLCPAVVIAQLTGFRADLGFCLGYLGKLLAEGYLTQEEVQMTIGEVVPTTIKRTKVPKAFRKKKSKK